MCGADRKSPVTTTTAPTVAAVLPQQRDVGKAEKPLSGAGDVSAIAGLGAELRRFAAELNDPIKRIAREFVIVEHPEKEHPSIPCNDLLNWICSIYLLVSTTITRKLRRIGEHCGAYCILNLGS